MKKITLIIIIAVFVIVGYLLIGQNSTTTTESDTVMTEDSISEGEDVVEEVENDEDSMAESEVKEFNLVATNFSFSYTEMKVKKGDTVRITLDVQDGFHDWVLDEFSAKTEQMQAGNKQTIEFVVDQAGEFEYYCSVGNHRQLGMVGTLIVEE